MAAPELDVVGMGNALVDVIAHVDDTFLTEQALTKGAMTLIDATRAQALYDAMPPAVERSGGSAGNTMAGIASLGGRGAYIGKIAPDELGDVFRHDIRAIGVRFEVDSGPPDGLPTGRCLICVTPDAQRTMQTYLGAGMALQPSDVDDELVASAQITFLEGYLWDPPGAKQAFRKAAQIAHAAGRQVALSLSDPFCVERFRDEFVDLVEHHVDVLFANEHEIVSLYQAASFDDALQRVRAVCSIAALTRSEKGSVVVSGDEVHVIDAEPIARVVDTTGAGDLYAAGFLYGLTSGADIRTCARIASIAAAEVIGHTGPRPETSLATLVAQKLSG